MQTRLRTTGLASAGPDRPERARARAPVATVRVPSAASDPLWYRDAVIYEVHVRAFRDSNGDGVGDFRGLTEKLDYLHDLGVTALWLLPFYPSPLRDDGYDIADYEDVHPAYGTLRDAETMFREAHRRGIKVITELVCNHTSDQHPWFQRARRARPGSAWRDYYVWSDTPDRYQEARIIFQDFETSNWTWDPVAGAYYWHRFFSHQPDLNFDNPRVRAALTRSLDFWLDRGVDGLRLDAIPYLYEREGTDCENLPETHEFLRELRRHVDEKYPGRILLAEANQWPEQSAAYFGKGDECHMAFNFPVMPRMFMALRMEDRLPIVDIVEQTPPIPDNAQWALFLRNHDELTLEMVTDEERDYMYRVYAGDPQARVNVGIRRRLAPLMGNHRRRIELMNGLLFSLPGTPVVYYGDEIGMGDNVYLGDRDSVRTPMQWNGDRNAGFSGADREQLYLPVVTSPDHHYEAVNVQAQQANTHSLLWWMKRMIALRKRHPAFARGDLRFLSPDNRHVIAFLREFDGERILVVANLSRFFQPVELDLSAFEGDRPVEMFGRIEFPLIGRPPYLLTLGPHEFLWFSLESRAGAEAGRLPVLPAQSLDALPAGLPAGQDARLRAALLAWLRRQPWYRGEARKPVETEIVNRIAIRGEGVEALLVALQISYAEGDPETYLLPLEIVDAPGDRADGAPVDQGRLVASLRAADEDGRERFLVDASADAAYQAALQRAISDGRRYRGAVGELQGRRWQSRPRPTDEVWAERRLFVEQRRVYSPGPDPAAEVMRYLSERGAPWSPRAAGQLDYRPAAGQAGCAALLREALVSDGDLASLTSDSLQHFVEQAATRPDRPEFVGASGADVIAASSSDLPELGRQLLPNFLDVARSIGNRVGELHSILASEGSDPDFAPEQFTRHYQASLFQAIDQRAVRLLRQLRTRSERLAALDEADRATVMNLRSEIKARTRLLLERRFEGRRIRTHGGLDLKRVLRSPRGQVLIDFDPEAPMAPSERRLKRSGLSDVAALVRSIELIALGRLRADDLGGLLRPEDKAAAEVWARQWFVWVAGSLVRGYRETTAGADFVPGSEAEWAALLQTMLIGRALSHLTAELDRDSGDLETGLHGLLELLGR